MALYYTTKIIFFTCSTTSILALRLVASTLLGFFFALSPWIGRVVFEARGKWRLQLFLFLFMAFY